MLSLLTAAILLAGTAQVSAATVEQPSRNMGDYSFAIAQQPLVSALNAFTAVTGWQVGLPAELAEGVASPGVHGSLPPEKALDRLLVGTNLSYRKLGNHNIVLEKRSVGGTLALQQMTISATRQEQSVDSVPSTVTVHTREELDHDNVNTIKELVRYEPGVSVGGTGTRGGISGYNIRGIDGDPGRWRRSAQRFLQRSVRQDPAQLRRPGNRQTRGNPPRSGVGALRQQRHRWCGELLHPRPG
jgi:hemoglobin/transferrin/lactoferrin receptor protein